MADSATVTLPPEFTTELCTRLSSVEDLRLPAVMCREQATPPTAATITAYLMNLLERDAAVFLERYGGLLSARELSSFHVLRDNYEVDYWLSQAEQKVAAASTGVQINSPSTSGRIRAVSKTAANRRLAYMYQLEQQGEYFMEANMRAREPLVWHEYIGQYEGQPPPPGGPVPGEGLAGSLLAAHEEVMIRARLQQQLQEEECQLSEHESDSESDRQQQHDGSGASGDVPMKTAADVCTPVPGVKPRQQGSATGGSQTQQQHQQLPDMSAGAMRRRRQEFLEEMQSRFLLGLDDAHQEYAVIDADASLDEAWAAQQAQDAEDAYFDAD